jgi:hypothetical protein
MMIGGAEWCPMGGRGVGGGICKADGLSEGEGGKGRKGVEMGDMGIGEEGERGRGEEGWVGCWV